MEPTGVILTFYTVNGKQQKPPLTATHYAPFHYLGPFEPSTVRSVQVGDQVALYGSILKQINGILTKDYIHLRKGLYTFDHPFQWLTLHADQIV
jgi:hypothetical protein